ncbi:hypothetical protein GCM10010404_81500 [Nonomuraea africana]
MHSRGLCRADYDRIVVSTLGAPVRRPAVERYARFLQLDRPGVTAQKIAFELGVSARLIERYRHRKRMAAASDTPEPRDREGPPVRQQAIPGLDLDLTDAHHRQRLAKHLVKVASYFAFLIRDQGPDAAAAYKATLPQVEQDNLPYLLAAMVDIDRTEEELLAWITWDEEGRPLPGAPQTPHIPAERAEPRRMRPPGVRSPCPSAAALKRHRELSEPPCDACRAHEQAVQRSQYERRKTSRSAA